MIYELRTCTLHCIYADQKNSNLAIQAPASQPTSKCNLRFKVCSILTSQTPWVWEIDRLMAPQQKLTHEN